MMDKKDKSSGSSEEKGNPDISIAHPGLKEADAAASFAAPKNEASVKGHGPVNMLRSKLGQLMGGSHAGASYEPGSAKPDKGTLYPDMPEPDSKRGISKIDALKGGRKKVMSSDINSLSERLSELEEHTREMHAKFDEFVLKSEKFMDYGQFIEVRKEVEEKIRLLDKIEKSLDDSRNQIVKDSGYMDSILGGFKYTKERIEILEKQMDSLLKAERAKSHPSILNKIRGAVDPQNIKSRIDSSKLSGLGRTVSELKKQMDALKESESNALKEVERLKKESHVYDKNTDNNLPETVKSLNKEMDELKERVAGYPDRDELAMIKEQISEFAVKFDELNKRLSEGVKGEDAEKEIKTAMSELKKEVDLKVDALRGAQNSVGREEFAEFVKENKRLISGLQRDDDVDAKKRIEALEKNVKSIFRGAGKTHANIFGKLLGDQKGDASCAKVPQGDKRILELSRQVADARKSDEKVRQELESMKGKMVSQEALESVRSRMYYLSKARKQNHVAEFEKKQDELKDEMAKLKRDIRQIPAMQSSMEQISLAVNSLREDIRKDVDSKSMQSIDRGARDDDIAEVKGNIEKLKAMSQDL
ncbi:MAG: hypothetical protein U9Q92_04765 [archaeon]|nr:hypothetical protein [archaeon]